MKYHFTRILCIFLLILPFSAQAAGWQAARPKNPEIDYEYYVEQTDGSEQLIFAMLDEMNDEASDMSEGGALYIQENHVDVDGNSLLETKIILQDSEFGPMFIYYMDEYSMITYVLDTFAYATIDGELVSEPMEIYTQEDIEFYLESYHFPYGSLEMLNGVRQDDHGYTYFLIQSDETASFEFVVGENMRIEELRIYMRNSDNELCLESIVGYSTGESLEIPAHVRAAMVAHGAKSAS